MNCRELDARMKCSNAAAAAAAAATAAATIGAHIGKRYFVRR